MGAGVPPGLQNQCGLGRGRVGSIPTHSRQRPGRCYSRIMSRALSFVLIALAAYAAGQAVEVKKNSPERKAMLDALRVPVQEELRSKVQFKINWFKRQGDWAFMKGVPVTASGGKIDYSRTGYARALKDGMFDDWICGLFKRKDGKWKVVRYQIGATDVCYEPWPKQFGAPKAIFYLP
jgi:hypothetical protein